MDVMTNGVVPQARGSGQEDDSPTQSDANMPQSIPHNHGGSTEVGRTSNGPLKVRKRTKTGCLTCRRRRIKCGEERPTCKNCTKSKRDCEGYIPRVVFKDPFNTFRSDVDGIHDHHTYGHHGFDAHGVPVAGTTSADGIPLAPLAPRPTSYDQFSGARQIKQGASSIFANNYVKPSTASMGQHSKSQGLFNPVVSTQGIAGQGYAAYNQLNRTNRSNGAQTSYSSQSAAGPNTFLTKNGMPTPVTSWPQINTSVNASGLQYPTPLSGHSSDGTFPSHTWPTQSPIGNLNAPNLVNEQGFLCSTDMADEFLANQAHEQNQHYGLPTLATQYKNEPEDDWFDVDSEEENPHMTQQLGKTQPSDLGLILSMNAQQNTPNVRSMANFLTGPNVLSTYAPSYSASPLMDPQTARVFCHFVSATGPSLNVFERGPFDTSAIFSGHAPPVSKRSFWSYTIPMLALTHQGLLHAMLALSSLHIAKIQRASPTPSLKHYHYALRRVAKALGKPEKRSDVATLAATLLLGFYEVTTAEHNKWNSHLSGARELVMEIDFINLARRIELHRKRQQSADAKMVFQHDPSAMTNLFTSPTPHEVATRASPRLDDHFIQTITGWDIRYDEHGPIVDGTHTSMNMDIPLKPSDFENFEIKSDLFWWYAKQDMFQSILSGNRLLLAYERWGQCPPRAPMGRQDASWGTFDHLMLLLARLADWTAADLPRKRRATRAREKLAKAQSQANAGGPPPFNGPGGQPSMHGMIPDPGPIRLPSGFDQGQHDRLYSTPVPSESQTLETATAEAEAEHAAITHAFNVFYEALGPSFEPLSAEHMAPISTPFGPAIYYRSYSIACIISLYYCGRIILERSRPSMPPAAMAAAGVAAAATAGFGTIIGRISAGIQPVSNVGPLNPQHGAALMDSCMGLFHAGVQYRDAAQRGWCITKLRDIARLTGWQTSALIASGCERAWIRAAEMGRGPPYERTMNQAAKDDRVAGRSRDPRLLANPPRDNNDRRFVRQNAGTRVYWAMGILSVEEDMREMSLEEEREGQT